MHWFDLAAALTVLAALASWLNHRFLGLPTTIGLTIVSMALSVGLILLGNVWPEPLHGLREVVGGIDFDETLLHGMLGFLLFAGALHVNLDDLREQAGPIAVLATLGLLISTAIIGSVSWALLQLAGLSPQFIHCLIFGALISPTDPISVLSILGSVGAPKTLETKIAGESLFNDGVAVVLFIVLLRLAGLDAGHGEGAAHAHVDVAAVAWLLLQETGGGAVFGLLTGLAAYRMLRSVNNYQVEILISLALVAGGYAGARALHVSGPIAMVVAGLLMGNQGRAMAMSERTREHLDTFWELVDEMLNAVLFVLVGIEVLALEFSWGHAAAAAVAVVLVLGARSAAVVVPMALLKQFRTFTPHAEKVLIWGGLRGGISVALALSLAGTLGVTHPSTYELLLFVTYTVVAFSIIVQGLTVAPLVRRLGLATR